MKILIINQHSLNYGDDLAGIALINNLLKMKNIDQIDLIYNTPGKLPLENKKLNHNREISMKKIGFINIFKYFFLPKKIFMKTYNKELKKFLNIIDKADYIYVSPCGANIGIYKDWRFLLRLFFVIKEKKTPIFHLNTIGKSNSKIFDFFALKVLRKSKIYVREMKSYEYLKSKNIDSVCGIDTAFSFEDDRKLKKRKNIITFIPTPLRWHPLYNTTCIDFLLKNNIINNISQFVKTKNLKIELVPHLNSEIEKNLYLKVEQEFRKRNVDVKIRKDINDVFKYYRAIESSEFLIGMRYHSIVVASSCSTPFISLSYENKMQEVCNYMNMKKYSYKLYDKNTNYNNMTKQLNYMFDNYEKISANMKETLNKIKYLSMLPLNEIKEEKNEK